MEQESASTIEDSCFREAFEWIQQWLTDAANADLREPQAACLSTADLGGHVTSRMVLVRRVEPTGFVFFTNSLSVKGRQLADNPRAALCYYWDKSGRQLRIEGRVEAVTDEESDAYWEQRPRESQLASAVSRQSELLPTREAFIAEVFQLAQELGEEPVPRPRHWHGYRVIPERIEFFTALPARMHERVMFQRSDQRWTKHWLYP